MELHLPDGRIAQVETAGELESELASLGSIAKGGVIELKESQRHTIRAQRDDDYWVVSAKPRCWWFRQTLTTGDWIDPAQREGKPFWVERGTLSDAKVQTVFTEFFEGNKFSQPIEGGGF